MISSGEISGGEPGVYKITWEKSSDNSNWTPIATENTSQLQPGILPSDLYFRRIIKSGPYDCCLSTSNTFAITVDKKPDLAEAGSDREIVYQDTFYIRAKLPDIGTGVWTTGSDATIVDPDAFVSEVRGLTFGEYVFYWTVTNGVCPAVSDSVVLILNDIKRFTGFSPNGDNINDFL
ncbi:MAG: hypothetical protein HC905_04745 [Bacteroidales bacterium]|nr:hypothetical protein [Bacteroidales bacterium]